MFRLFKGHMYRKVYFCVSKNYIFWSSAIKSAIWISALFFFIKKCRANTLSYVETNLIILRCRNELPSLLTNLLDQFHFLGWFSQLHAKRLKSYFILYKYVYKTNCFIFYRFRIIIRYKYVYYHTFSIQFFPLSIYYE